MDDFPVSDYYKNHIIDSYTLSRSNLWWSAILAIKDPRNGKNFLKIYKWQYDTRVSKWKNIEEFKINDKQSVEKIILHLKAFSELI